MRAGAHFFLKNFLNFLKNLKNFLKNLIFDFIVEKQIRNFTFRRGPFREKKISLRNFFSRIKIASRGSLFLSIFFYFSSIFYDFYFSKILLFYKPDLSINIDRRNKYSSLRRVFGSAAAGFRDVRRFWKIF